MAKQHRTITSAFHKDYARVTKGDRVNSVMIYFTIALALYSAGFLLYLAWLFST